MYCKQCKKEKSSDEFYKSDINVCKSCRKDISRHNYTIRKNEDLSFTQTSTERHKKWRNKYPLYSWIHTSRDKHKRNGYIITFTSKEFVEKFKHITNCPYCGINLDFTPNSLKQLCNRPTLDRINNENIMTLENVQILCHTCNTAKGSMPHKIFINYIKKIVSRCSNDS
jgi:5-methylcytosine-specific restriction endonuclease McrA